MSELDDVISAVEERLRKDFDVDAGLSSFRETARGTRSPGELVEQSSRFMRHRLRALEGASEQLKRLDGQLRELSSLLPILPGEWPVRRQQLNESLDRDVLDGVSLWLSDWWQAVGLGRLDAMERLVDELRPRSASAVLVDRAEVIRLGLEQGSWRVVALALEPVVATWPGAAGLMPHDTSHARLAALVARLWVLHDEQAQQSPAGDQSAPVDMTPYLERVAHLGLPAVAAGLGSRWQRLRGDVAEAERWLARCDEDDTTDLDVAIELIEQARRQGKTVSSDDAASAAVAAVPLIGEVERRITALLHPAPVELWIATAQRALDEQQYDVFDRAVEKSLGLADWQDRVSRARIAELKLAAADQQHQPADKVVAALIEAGSNRLWSGSPELATAHLERALRLDPPNLDAGLLLADSLLSGCGSLPLKVTRPRLHRVLDLVDEARTRGGLDRAHSWAYMTQAYANESLLDDVDPRADSYGWAALLSACRALAYDLNDITRWRKLSDTLTVMRADGLALDIARHVVRTLANGPSERQMHAEKLANTGFPGEALEALEPVEDFRGGDTSSFVEAVRAYCILRLGDPGEAARLLRSVQLDPDWTWATETLITALLLTGRIREVESEVAALGRRWVDRLDERSAVVSMGLVRLLQGRFAEAEELCRGLPDRLDDSGLVLASSLMLQGRDREAVAGFETWIRESAQRGNLSDWSKLIAPQLRVLGVHHRVDIRGVDELQALADARLAELPWPSYPGEAGVVGRFRADPNDPVARLAVGMCDALVHVARRAHAEAADSLAELGDDEVVGELRRSLEELAALHGGDAADSTTTSAAAPSEIPSATVAEESSDDGSEPIARVVHLAADRRLEEAREQLRALLSRDAYSLAWDLATAAADDYATYDAVMDVLQDMAQQPDGAEATAAGQVWDQLRRWVALRLALPPSWFAGYDDPVATHVLFTHYIPEARTRTPQMPGVRVTTDDDLEPAGYVVMLGTRVLERNLLPTGRRFAPSGAESLLGAGADAQWEEVLPGFVAVPDGYLTALGELASLSAEELAVRRASQVFKAWLAQPEEPALPVPD